MLPRTLYHAAPGKFSELQPGFKRTGKLVEWDFGENNHYLYAIDNKDDVIALGFGSAVEKICLIDRYRFNDKEITIDISEGEDAPSMEKLQALEIYVYSIKVAPEHMWLKNNNKHNGLTGEYKTTVSIPDRYFTVEKVDVKKWLEDKKLTLIEP